MSDPKANYLPPPLPCEHGIGHFGPVCPKCFQSAETIEIATLRARLALLEAAGDKLYSQVMDANGWINVGAIKPGAGLCICYDLHDIEFDDANIIENHHACCVAFREALSAWRAAKEGR